MSDDHEKLAEMIENDDFMGMPKTPALIKLIKIQYTQEEAALAINISMNGKDFDEILKQTGMEQTKLKKMLDTMSEKGTIWFDPAQNKPIYKAVGMIFPGLLETGLLGNIRFPYSVELGKAIHSVLHEWVDHTFSRLPPGSLPLWTAPAALPEDADPSDNLLARVLEYDDWCVAFCPCKLSHRLDTPGDHCRHLLETCMPRGELGRWCVEAGMARRITTEEAVEIIQKCAADGLVHTGDPGTNVLCNCCHDCCPYFISWHHHGVQLLKHSNYIPEVYPDECTRCAVCEERCPVGAIEVEDTALIKKDICIGCGVCVSGCSTKAIKMAKRA